MAEDRTGSARDNTAAIPVADGRLEDRTAESESPGEDRQAGVFIVKTEKYQRKRCGKQQGIDRENVEKNGKKDGTALFFNKSYKTQRK